MKNIMLKITYTLVSFQTYDRYNSYAISLLYYVYVILSPCRVLSVLTHCLEEQEPLERIDPLKRQ